MILRIISLLILLKMISRLILLFYNMFANNLRYLKCLKSGLYYKIIDLMSNKSNNPINIVLKNNHNNSNTNKSLNIMTYNIDGLFVHFNKNNYLNISNFIKDQFLNNNIDVIALQEVWLSYISNLIIDELNDLDLYISIPPTTKKYYLGEHSGLMIISKYPILTSNYIEYNNCNFTCKLSKKGLQHITIEYNKKIINIINTHLQSSFKNFHNLQYQSTAEKQLNIIRDYCIKKKLNEYIIIGDLNINMEYMERYLSKNKNICLKYNQEYKNICTFPSTNEMLDYCLFSNIFHKNIIEYKLYDNINYSDHLPLLIKILDLPEIND